VREFETTPVICIKDGPLKNQGPEKRYFYAGNILVRNVAAKSEVIRTAEDMHALIRLGVNKTSDRLLSDFRRILDGGNSSETPSMHQSAIEKWSSEQTRFLVQSKEKYPNFSTFTVLFLPQAGGDRNLSHKEMLSLMQASQIIQQGHEFPYDVYGSQSGGALIHNRDKFIEGTLDLQVYREIWQVHNTGSFMLARLLKYVDSQYAGVSLPFERIIHSVVMSLRFAQRFYQDTSPDQEISYEFSLIGAAGHRLGTFDDFMMSVGRRNYTTKDDFISTKGIFQDN
jgi:hypothetical protein